MHRFDAFIEGVTSGKIPSNELVHLAVKRHLNDLKKANTKEFPFIFDRARAQKFINFVLLLKHTKGKWAKKQFNLLPWQAFKYGSLFGWVHKDTGFRRFRKSYNSVARKGGKTEDSAAVGLYGLIADGVYGSEVYSAATKRDQAKICFDRAKSMAKLLQEDSKVIKENLSIQRINISILKNESKFEPLSSEHEKQDGLFPHFAIIDEFHAVKDDGLARVIETGMAGDEPLLYFITTAGFNTQSPCFRLRQTCIEILKGIKKDETVFCLIFTLDDGDDWHDEKTWYKSNPSLGSSPTLAFMRSQYQKAINEGFSAEVNFKTKNLNIWTTTRETFINDEIWRSNTHGMNPDNLRGLECVGGLDLAATRDITALVLLFNVNGIICLLPFFWLPEETAQYRQKTDGIPYMEWAKQGFIELTEGNTLAENYIETRVEELMNLYKIKSIAFDRWGSVRVITNLQDMGIKVSPFGQGFGSMNTPTKELEIQAYKGNFEHFDNPVLRWMNSNIAIDTNPAGDIKITKKKSSEKVDGMVATVMALGESMTVQEEESYTLTNGIKFF